MVIDEINVSSSYQLARVLGLLESQHGITIDFDAAKDLAELRGLYEACGLERSRIIRESSFNSCNNDPTYTRAVLIQEAINIFLSEVAPKRLRRKNHA